MMGGAGMIQALGGRLLKADGREIGRGGAALVELERIDLCGLDPRLATVRILVACDVDNPLCGAKGASAIFGPKKGQPRRWYSASMRRWPTMGALSKC